MKKNTYLFLLILISLYPFGLSAQDSAGVKIDTACVQKDLGDVVRSALNKPAKEKSTKSGSLLLIPVIGSNPATGFVLGVGGQYAFKMPESTLYSLISGSAQASTKNQYIFMLKNSIYSKKQRFFHSGDWRFLIYSQPTYGLGTTAPQGGILEYQYSLNGLNVSSDSLAQPMKFNFIRLHQTMGVKIVEGVYAGLGYHFDGYYKIKDEKLRLNPGDSLITSHYGYSSLYGFNTASYYSSAINVSLVMDTRDNMRIQISRNQVCCQPTEKEVKS